MIDVHLVLIDNMKDIPIQQSNRWAGFTAAFTARDAARTDIEERIECDVVKHDRLSDHATWEALFDADGIILSGSKYSLSSYDHKPRVRALFEPQLEFARRTNKPVLGICFGHELIAIAHGMQLCRCGLAEKGIQSIHVKDGFRLLQGEQEAMVVEQHHVMQVDPASLKGSGFENFGGSATCEVQLLQHALRPIFGVQFHPETLADPVATRDGRALLVGFLDLVGE